MNKRERENYVIKFLATANRTECSDEFIDDIETIIEYEIKDMFPLLDGKISDDDFTTEVSLSDYGIKYASTSTSLKKLIHELYPERLIWI